MALQSAVENVARFCRLPRTCSGCDIEVSTNRLTGILAKVKLPKLWQQRQTHNALTIII